MSVIKDFWAQHYHDNRATVEAELNKVCRKITGRDLDTNLDEVKIYFVSSTGANGSEIANPNLGIIYINDETAAVVTMDWSEPCIVLTLIL